MDLKQIARAAVNRWRNKSFSPNETASEPTSARTEVTASTETPATTVVTLTVAGADEAPRVFTVTASSFSISYQGNRTFINIPADTFTGVDARPVGDVPAKDVQQPVLDTVPEVPALSETTKAEVSPEAEVLPESSASPETPASSEAPFPLETQASREEETAPIAPASPETPVSSEASLSLETQAPREGEIALAAPASPEASTKENTPARMNADIISFLNRTCELRFNVLTECTECRLKGGKMLSIPSPTVSGTCSAYRHKMQAYPAGTET